MNDLKITLESLVARYNTTAFTENDPVLFPRRFLGKSKQDIEVAAFLASTIAWGNRKQIMAGCQKMLFEIMGGKPYDFVMQGGWKHIDPNCNIHRTFFGRDLAYMCEGLRFAYWMIPLDVHVARIGRELGLITRKSNDRKTVEELTRRLADFDPKDPCKYDFALFGYGEQQNRIGL